MIKRFISAIFIFYIFFASIFYFQFLFIPVILVIHIVMIYEWYLMVKFSFNKELLFGIILILLSLISVLYIFCFDSTRVIIFSYFCIIWSVDIFAMIIGKLFSHTKKLAPKVSPQKTWVGFFSGSISTSATILLLDYLKFDIASILKIKICILMIFTIFLGMIAQVSDLLVSYFKRKFSIKDSGTIIPGHGGILDRFDSILLTAPILALTLSMYKTISINI